jgi:hypothetical protein
MTCVSRNCPSYGCLRRPVDFPSTEYGPQGSTNPAPDKPDIARKSGS